MTVDADAERGRRRTADALRRIYSNFEVRDIGAVAVAGPIDDVVAGLQDVIDAGAELVVLNPLFDDVEQLELLAAEVLPQLR